MLDPSSTSREPLALPGLMRMSPQASALMRLPLSACRWPWVRAGAAGLRRKALTATDITCAAATHEASCAWLATTSCRNNNPG